MRGKSFEKNSEGTDQIAKERLKLMVENLPFEHSAVAAQRMRKEISDIISRYYEMNPENYEIRVILKQNRKRA